MTREEKKQEGERVRVTIFTKGERENITQLESVHPKLLLYILKYSDGINNNRLYVADFLPGQRGVWQRRSVEAQPCAAPAQNKADKFHLTVLIDFVSSVVLYV